jgi:hypothetical protein
MFSVLVGINKQKLLPRRLPVETWTPTSRRQTVLYSQVDRRYAILNTVHK